MSDTVKPVSHIRVLIAEDTVIGRKMLIHILTSAGVTPKAVADGLEAVAAFQSGTFDLIFMDLEMPNMDGFEAVRRIRELERLQAVPKPAPVIALTAHGDVKDPSEWKRLGFTDMIVKPISARHLLKMLDACVPGWRGSCAGEAEPDPSETPGPPPPSSSVLDVEMGVHRSGGSLTLFRSVIDFFVSDRQRYQGDLMQMIRDKDYQSARLRAHSLKGTAAAIGAAALSEAASQLDRACGRDHDDKAIQTAMGRMETEFGRLLQAIDRWKKENPS